MVHFAQFSTPNHVEKWWRNGLRGSSVLLESAGLTQTASSLLVPYPHLSVSLSICPRDALDKRAVGHGHHQAHPQGSSSFG